MTSGASGARPDPAWEAFAARHTGSPFLGDDALYALTEPIIDAIKSHLPDFFDKDQEGFERDLARTASFGFFLRRPFGSEAEASSDETEPSLEQRAREVSQTIDDLLAEELRRAGASTNEVSEYFEGTAARSERMQEKRDAFAGWLLTNPTFHREARAFRRRCEGAIRTAGRFPTLPLWIIPERLSGKKRPRIKRLWSISDI